MKWTEILTITTTQTKTQTTQTTTANQKEEPRKEVPFFLTVSFVTR